MMILASGSTMQKRRGNGRGKQRSRTSELRRIVDPRLRSFLRYWLVLRGDRLVPDRRDFDPAEVAPLLGYFWICCKEPKSGRFRFRLAGDEIRNLVGRRVAGAYIEDVFPAVADELIEGLETILKEPALYHSHGPFYRGDNRWIEAERLALPVSFEGAVTSVLGATIFSWPAGGKPIAAQLVAGKISPTIIPVAEISIADLTDQPQN